MYGGAFVDGSLYISFDRNYWNNKPGLTHGLLKIDPKTNETEVLLSNRRTPQANSLEGTMKEPPLGFFKGPGNALFLYFGNAPYAFYKQSDRLGDWQSVPSYAAYSSDVSIADDGAIFHSTPNKGLEKVYWFGRESVNSELLLQNPDLLHKDPQEPRWNFPQTLRHPNTDTKCLTAITMDDGNLWIFAKDVSSESMGGINPRLYFFARESKDAIEIPVQMDFPSDENAKLVQAGFPQVTQDLESSASGPIIMTPEGLILPGRNLPGFWFIPRKDLDDYVKNLPKQ
jgi:hypothetical protein